MSAWPNVQPWTNEELGINPELPVVDHTDYSADYWYSCGFEYDWAEGVEAIEGFDWSTRADDPGEPAPTAADDVMPGIEATLPNPEVPQIVITPAPGPATSTAALPASAGQSAPGHFETGQPTIHGSHELVDEAQDSDSSDDSDGYLQVPGTNYGGPIQENIYHDEYDPTASPLHQQIWRAMAVLRGDSPDEVESPAESHNAPAAPVQTLAEQLEEAAQSVTQRNLASTGNNAAIPLDVDAEIDRLMRNIPTLDEHFIFDDEAFEAENNIQPPEEMPVALAVALEQNIRGDATSDLLASQEDAVSAEISTSSPSGHAINPVDNAARATPDQDHYPTPVPDTDSNALFSAEADHGNEKQATIDSVIHASEKGPQVVATPATTHSLSMSPEPMHGQMPEPAQAEQNNGIFERDLANIMMMLSRYRSESLPPSVPGNHVHMETEAGEDKDPSTDTVIVQDVPEDVGVVQDAPVTGQATPTSRHSAEELITSAKTDISSNLNLVDAEAEDVAANDEEDHDDGNSITSHHELTSEEIKRGIDTELAEYVKTTNWGLPSEGPTQEGDDQSDCEHSTTSHQELTSEEIKRGIDTELAEYVKTTDWGLPSKVPTQEGDDQSDYEHSTTNRQELTSEETKRGIDTELAQSSPHVPIIAPAPPPSLPTFVRHPFEMDYGKRHTRSDTKHELTMPFAVQVPASGPSTAAPVATGNPSAAIPQKRKHAGTTSSSNASKGTKKEDRKGKGKKVGKGVLREGGESALSDVQEEDEVEVRDADESSVDVKGKGKAKAKAADAEYAPPKTRHAAALEAAEAEKGKKGKGKRKRGV